MHTTTERSLNASLAPSLVAALTPLIFAAACASGEATSRPGSNEAPSPTEETSVGTTEAEESTSGSEDASTGDGPELPDPGDGAKLAEQAQAILDKNCSQCHGAGSPAAGGMDYVTDLAALVANAKVIPSDPEGSPIYARISTDTMPPAGVEQRPSADDVVTIYKWIMAGAPSGPAPTNCEDQGFISNDDIFREMNEDLLSPDLQEGDLPFIRYLTLTHLYNSGVCDKDLEIYRQAVAKVVNSLSLGLDVEPPVAIDDAKTIFRIDMRHYGWNDHPLLGDVWEAVAEENPFAIRFLGDLASPLRNQLQTTIPNQPADSFLQVATRGQLYYDILLIPDTLDKLQAKLGVDVQANINDGTMLRAGIAKSGVSKFNRVFDRHPLGGGQYYYESSDFNSNADDANVFIHPLDFVRAGGEMIFSLKNGFQGYAIEANGAIITEAPINVVVDLQQRDLTVRAGISCMSCHQNGIIERDDEFRDYYNEHKSDFNADRAVIEEIYDKGQMQKKQAADIAVFAAALVQVDIPTTGPEPIITTSLEFEADIDLRRAAAELGVSPDTLEDELAGLDSQLDRLDGGKVGRDVFAAVFAETACELIPGDRAFPDCLIPN